jgi:hypothetical protein
MTTTTKDEGPRGFAVLLQQIDEGSLHDELSIATRDLARTLCEYANKFGRAGKGELTLTIGMSVDAKGVAAVTGAVKSKLPKVPKVSSQFFLTASSNLTLENPRQQKLPLREVAPPAPPRDVPVEMNAPARSL